MKKLKIGIIGGGSIARHCHLPGYAADPDCILAAIADPEAASLQAVRQKWPFEHEYADYREMLEHEQLDLVSVCTPNKFHAGAAIAAMESGADVILEKPIAINLTEAQQIADAVKRTGRRLAVGFSHRYNNLIRAARQSCEAGTIGKLYMLRIRFAHGGPYPGWASTDWFYNPELAGGGAVLDMSIHAFDLIAYLAGPITTISAISATLRKPIAVEDNMVAICRVGDSCLGYIETSWTSPAGFNGVELYGDNGSIVINYTTGEAVLTSGVLSPEGTVTMEKQVIATSGVPPWQCEMAELLDACRNHKPFAAGIEQGVDALRVATAVYESSRTGREIRLDGTDFHPHCTGN